MACESTVDQLKWQIYKLCFSNGYFKLGVKVVIYLQFSMTKPYDNNKIKIDFSGYNARALFPFFSLVKYKLRDFANAEGGTAVVVPVVVEKRG
jgi:hypothetical protein